MVFATLCGVEAYAADTANGLATTGYVEGAVAAGVENKADKSTTLAGYGIGNAYTKTETDTAITNKINALDATNSVTAGNYITAVNETNGTVAITQAAMDTTPTANSTKPVTSGGVKSALDGKLSTFGTAAKATADASGNNIVNTYATKTELTNGLSGKQPTLTTGDTGNIKGTGSVTVSKDSTTGVITINGVDTDTKYTLPAATDTVRGGVMVDTALSATSTNPVQNKVVKAALDGKQASLGYTAENVANKTTTIAAAGTANDTKYPTEKAVRTALDAKADKTAIPTVNNATLTIQQNGTSVGTFTANQATNATVNVTVPTKVSQLTNDSSFATTTAVNAKQDTANIVPENDDNAETYKDSTTKYPSMKTMNAAIANAVDGLNDGLGALAYTDTISTDDIDNKAVTKAKLADAVQTSLNKADSALQSVSGGAAVSGKVATAVVKNGTAVSVTMDYVKIPVGSATAPTSVAQIWVQ